MSTQNPLQTLSVCMMVQNSEKTLALALESLGEIYDDLIIVDGGSTDSTCQIALSYGAKIIYSKWKGNHSEQRNVYLKEVKTDWVFVLDSDEFIDKKTLEFLALIKQQQESPITDNFWISRKWITPFNKKYYIASQPHYPDWQRRLFKYNEKIYYEGKIHEVVHGLSHQGIFLKNLSIYHLDLLINSESQRHQKVIKYSLSSPQDGMPHFYLPNIKNVQKQEWSYSQMLPIVQSLLEPMPVKCKVCESEAYLFDKTIILGKYEVDYFQCSNCGFVQTEDPYWLAEAYYNVIAKSDVGLVSRNHHCSEKASQIIFNIFDNDAKFLDYGGGYGIFVKMMKDLGFDFYWFDKFCNNLFAKGLEMQENNHYELVTAFEVFEHFVNPIEEIENILRFSRNILFSTEILPTDNPKPDEWWYYTPHEGQHISIYTLKALSIIADKYNLNFYSSSKFNGVSLHLLTEKKLAPDIFNNLCHSNTGEIKKVSLLPSSFTKGDGLSIVNNGTHIKIALDIAVLGLSTLFETAKTGVFRVTEHLLKGLIKYPQCQIYLCTSLPGLFNACQNYINQNFQDVNLPLLHFSELKYQNIDIYQSTHYPLPNNIYFATRIAIVCDLIPILFPEYFINNSQHLVMDAIDEIDNNDFVCCISKSTKQDICKYKASLNEKQVFVTYLAADQEKFYPCYDRELIIKTKQRYKIPNQPYLLSLSTLEPRKNIAHVIRCFLTLIKKRHIDDLNLVLIGTKGWQYEEIFAEIDRYKELEHRIIITGYLPDEDLAPLYSGALAFMYVSLYEGFGLPPLEAMQCGTPVITSNTSSLPEVVGDAGIMLDSHDEIGLCDAIFKLYSEPEYRENLAQKSVQQAEKFTWDKYVQETIKIYELAKEKAKKLPPRNILIDGVFFQINNTGIARVWRTLLKQWSNSDFANHILVLDRANTAPKINGIRYRTISAYDYNNTEADKQMLQQICDEEEAELFISSYYTTPIATPTVFMAHDMIPEVMGWDLNIPMWREKHQAIQNASQYIAVSEHTACDLVSCFPEISRESIIVAHCGVEKTFSPANIKEINSFKTKYGITKPYFILVGIENNNKNSILFFKAFSQLTSSSAFDIVCTGNRGTLAPEFRGYTLGSIVHILELSDQELAIAYSGAVALAYPSKYEGFGLPIVEAMACGCPVITCPNASIPEVAGEAAIYVNDDDVNALANALCEVQKSSVRNSLITAGLAQAKNFSWSTMANTVSAILIKGTILHLNLKEINLIVFPDWSQPEDLISLDLEIVIKTLATYSGSQKTTLIIDTSDIASEEAAILLSGVTMNLLMQEDIDITEGLEISLLGNLANIQWAALLPRISARIILEYENKHALEKYQQIHEEGNKFNEFLEECDVKEFIDNYDLRNDLISLLTIYKQEDSNISVLNELRLLRMRIAESLIHKEKNSLERLYLSKFGEAYQALLNSDIQNESITDSEQSLLNDVLARIAKGLNEQNAIQYLLVAMLYCRSHQLSLVYDLTEVPSWLLNDYLKFTFKPPLYFQEIGQADNYYQYMENLINYLHKNIISNSESKFWQDIAEYFTYTANFIPLYFNKANLKNIYTKRADIIKSYLYLQDLNQSIEYEFPERLDERVKIRVGILANHFEPQTETFATLSVYKDLNRDLFEIIIFTLNLRNHRLERYCIGHADALIQLPANLTNQVQTIRESDLDILFISTNITAVTHQITLLSLYRLARIQMVDANSPVTTGMPHIDYYISSKLSETEDNAQEHYTEQLITLDSPPQCFDFATEEQLLATTAISRESLAIDKTAIVYVSGANYYKITPDQEVTWTKIIASVPNSVLLLYPFNPNWSSSYPCIAFRKRIITTFAKYGLSEDRLIILNPAPNRADVKERLKLCDIYLDSYPYSGMTSLIDPLEVGLPTVVMEAESSRSRKGASLLRGLQIFDLITNTEEAYIELAVALATNSELRQQKAEQIKQKMHQYPIFLDSRSHSAKMGELFQEVFYKHQAIALKEQFNLKDINLIIFPDWSHPEDLLYQDLASVISSLTTHPDKSHITLLIDTQNISEEEADMLLSSLTMNLLMEGDIDITEGPEISLLGKISDTQWKTLLPRINTRIALATDNQSAIAQAKAENLPSCDVDSLGTS
jgi:predicted O-linked N-acetylglucosamine transferase (SPINDLY family)/glycosyltransferase involved in cell wall biosynthesis